MAAASPPKMTIGNMLTGQVLTAQYNPEEIEETIEANFQRLTIPGLSHQVLQFVNTGNLGVSFDLTFDSRMPAAPDIDFARSFLMALTYPTRQATSVATGGPARALFFWPGLYSLKCNVVKYKGAHKHFGSDASSQRRVLSVTLEEARDTRLYAEDVQRLGTLRGGT